MLSSEGEKFRGGATGFRSLFGKRAPETSNILVISLYPQLYKAAVLRTGESYKDPC